MVVIENGVEYSEEEIINKDKEIENKEPRLIEMEDEFQKTTIEPAQAFE